MVRWRVLAFEKVEENIDINQRISKTKKCVMLFSNI
jgi:hypothetical protein